MQRQKGSARSNCGKNTTPETAEQHAATIDTAADRSVGDS
jgi:hypothetical protein